MKYLIRAIKYFLYFTIIFSLIIAALTLTGITHGDIHTMFKDDSWWKILLIFVAAGALYPSVGYMKKNAYFTGGLDANRPKIIEVLSTLGFVLEENAPEKMTFRCKNKFHRLTRMYEDRITLTPDMAGVVVDGLRKEVVRVVMHLEHHLRSEETAEEQ